MSMDLRNIKSVTVVDATATYPTLAAALAAAEDQLQGQAFNFFPDGSGFFYNAIGYGWTAMAVATGGRIYIVTLIPGTA